MLIAGHIDNDGRDLPSVRPTQPCTETEELLHDTSASSYCQNNASLLTGGYKLVEEAIRQIG